MQKLLIIVFLLFLASNCHAQDSLNYGKVKTDTAFDCKNDHSRDPDFGITSICNSINEFELRLQGYSRPGGGSYLIVLTLNKQNWDVKKYERMNGALGDKLTTTVYRYQIERMKNYAFNHIFETLKINRIFTLPDQNELNLKGFIYDGAAYRLTFKVNNNFRSYWFENPESYLEQNPGMTELENYSTIVKTLSNLFWP